MAIPTASNAALGKPLVALATLWLAPGCTAAALLLGETGTSALGAFHHGVLLLALLLLLLLPFAADILRADVSAAQRNLIGGLMASMQLALAAFYFLSAIGFRYWGDWINAELIRAYAPHTIDLLRALDIPRSAVFAGVAMTWAALFLCHRALIGSILAARTRSQDQVAPRAGVLIIIAMVGSLMLFYRSYVIDDDFWWNEPLRQASLRAGFGDSGSGQFFTPERLQYERESIAAYRPAPPTGKARPLVLIIVDSMRSDLMGVYGGPVENTPFLSSLRKAGQLKAIENTYSACTVSYCGILATLSSRYWHQITPQPWNLADVLRKFGYESRFLLGGDHGSYFGIRKMYGPSVTLLRDGGDQKSRYNNDDRLVLDALDQTGWPEGKPGFMYIHLMSVHRLGLIDEKYKRWDGRTAPAWSRYGPVDPGKHNETRARYHNGILQADDIIRQIFTKLDNLHVLRDAVVIITSDHGEFLGEQDRWSHGQAPYEPVTRVPLLVFDRLGIDAYRSPPLSSQVDIGPTLLHAIGARAPANWSGLPLQGNETHDAIVVESSDTTGIVSILDGRRYKYLQTRNGGKESLFELRPGGGPETLDLAETQAFSGVLAELRSRHRRMTRTPLAIAAR